MLSLYHHCGPERWNQSVFSVWKSKDSASWGQSTKSGNCPWENIKFSDLQGFLTHVSTGLFLRNLYKILELQKPLAHQAPTFNIRECKQQYNWLIVRMPVRQFLVKSTAWRSICHCFTTWAVGHPPVLFLTSDSFLWEVDMELSLLFLVKEVECLLKIT